MKVLLLLLFICSFVANAAIESHVIQEKPIKVDVPKEWESVKDLFGLPLTVLGPWDEASESRAAISFSFTGMTTKIMTPEKFRTIFKDFKQKKVSWVSKHKGKLTVYEEVTPVTLTKDLKGHFIGAEFVINDIIYTERSYYLYCNNEVYHVKYSIQDPHRKHLKVIQEIIGSLTCK